jgi:hypothetical protein
MTGGTGQRIQPRAQMRAQLWSAKVRDLANGHVEAHVICNISRPPEAVAQSTRPVAGPDSKLTVARRVGLRHSVCQDQAVCRDRMLMALSETSPSLIRCLDRGGAARQGQARVPGGGPNTTTARVLREVTVTSHRTLRQGRPAIPHPPGAGQTPPAPKPSIDHHPMADRAPA